MFDFMVSLLTIGSIYGIMALGLNIQAGYGGLLNFGQIAFAGIGAYAVGIAYLHGWPLWVGGCLGVLVAMVVGWLSARLGRKLASDYWGIATLAIAEILRTVAINEDWLTGGANGISGIPSLFDGVARPWDSLLFMATVLALLAVFAWTTHRLGDGRFGRALRLMREEPKLASCMGYNVQSLKSRAVMLSAATSAIAGSFYALYLGFSGPEYMLAAETFVLWTMLMIGGLGRTGGVLLGVLLVQIAYAFVPFAKDLLGFSSDLAGAIRIGLIGLILLTCLLWRQEGLLPEKLRVIV